jgi:hypothetical protein
MGFFSDLFGGGGDKRQGEVKREPLIPQFQLDLGRDLSNFTRTFLKQFTPGKDFPGDLVVDKPSEFENIGLGLLGDFITKSPTGALFDAAKGQLMSTLQGDFADPATSPFIKSITTLANQNLQDQIDQTRARRGARGTFFTRAGIQEESRLTERTLNALNAVIGDFQNQERGRQLTAVPLAESLERFGSVDTPLKQIQAATTIGSLPRILEQASLEADYQDFLRKQSELGAVPALGNAVFSRNIPFQFTTTAPQPKSNFLDDIGPFVDLGIKLLPLIMSAGCWVAASVFQGWDDPRTFKARYFIHYRAPKLLRDFYMKHGARIAAHISDKPILKNVIRPVFELFSTLGEIAIRGRVAWQTKQ